MRSQKKFEKLLEPGYIGSVRTKNRLIKSAAGSDTGTKQGIRLAKRSSISLKHLHGVVWMIIIETSGVRGFTGKDSDVSIKQMAELTGLIHKYNCPVFVQLSSMINWKISKPNLPPTEGLNARAPSAVCVYSDMDNHNIMPEN